jgi:putative protease
VAVSEEGSAAGRLGPNAGQLELLAPAGDERALRAALAAGADAVYLGLERFSARAYAANFSPRALLEAIDRAHLWGARVYLALNTQIKQNEVATALKELQAPYEAGLNAVIVADVGFAALVRRSYPDLALHASTQLNTHSSAQLASLARLGFARATLARELSLGEIGALDPHAVQLEVFVHGALCYGYSGNCLFASMIGGRSGNRGRCTQACRMRYVLRRVGDLPRARGAEVLQEQPHADNAALAAGALSGRVLSCSDLAAIDVLPNLINAGVRAFKIEGRMKDVAYVATATAVYREALASAAADPAAYRVLPEWRRRLEQSFSRGFTAAHLEGHHAAVRSRDRGGHRGVAVGRVERVDEKTGRVTVRTSQPVAPGDVLTIFTPWGQTEAVRVPPEAIEGPEGAADQPGTHGGGRVTLSLRERVAVKDRVFRLAAAGVDAFAESAAAGRVVARPLLLAGDLTAVVGRPARLRLRADVGAVEVEGGEPLAAAERARLNAGTDV